MSTDDSSAADRGSELSDQLGLEAETVKAPRTAELYLLLVRHCGNYWTSHSSHQTAGKAAEAAKNQAAYFTGGEAWRIVVVRDLPIEVDKGEA